MPETVLAIGLSVVLVGAVLSCLPLPEPKKDQADMKPPNIFDLLGRIAAAAERTAAAAEKSTQIESAILTALGGLGPGPPSNDCCKQVLAQLTTVNVNMAKIMAAWLPPAEVTGIDIIPGVPTN